MGIQNIRDKRRTTRNKTIIIDYKPDVDDPPSKFIDVSYPVQNNGGMKNPSVWSPNANIGERTIPFSELMSAFQKIDNKRVGFEFANVNDALKRFKTDEEHFTVSNVQEEKSKIESEFFPKLSDNIFFKNRDKNDWTDFRG